jgi:hypothetical protein
LYQAQETTDPLDQEALWKQVQDLISKNPKHAADRYDESLPLHVALTSNAPLNLIQRLIRAHPQACKQWQFIPTRFPLILAIHWKKEDTSEITMRQKDELIRCVFNEAPEMGAKRGEAQATILHLLLELQPRKETVEYLVYRVENLVGRRKKNLCTIQDDQGQLPLHVALEYHCSDEVIEYLLQKYSLAIQVARVEKLTPLHVALLRGCTKRVLSLLLAGEGFKQLWTTDDDGNIPLHLWFSRERIQDNHHRLHLASTNKDILSEDEVLEMILRKLTPRQAQDLLQRANGDNMKMIAAAQAVQSWITYPEQLLTKMEKFIADADTDDEKS